MYYTLKQLKEKKIAPMVFLNAMKERCKCGELLLRNEKLTKTTCADVFCPVHMAYRAVRMLHYLGIKGYGKAKCYEIIKAHGLFSQFGVLKYLINYKPSLYLWEIAKLDCIEGYDEKTEEIFAKYSSFKEYFDNNTNIPKEILNEKFILEDAEQYFDIKHGLSGECIYVAIHGSIPGFSNRSDYIQEINNVTGNVIRVVEKGARLSNDFVITTSPNSGQRKLECARRAGTPIVTPKEFEAVLMEVIKKKLYADKFGDELTK